MNFLKIGLRKYGLTTYVGMLRQQDQLHSHKFYRRAAKDLLRIYSLLLDEKRRAADAGAATSDARQDGQVQELSAAEKKKLKHAAKRAGKKAETEKEAQKELIKSTVLPCTIVKSEDPNGTDFLKSIDPEAEALKLVEKLSKVAASDPHTFSGR